MRVGGFARDPRNPCTWAPGIGRAGRASARCTFAAPRTGRGLVWVRRTARVLACVAAFFLFPALPARAQDFDAPLTPGGAGSAARFLEHGLPPAATHSLDLLAVGRYALPELGSRALAASAGWRSVRAAAGLSQTGDPEIGWTALGVAAGVSAGRWGAGVRAVARRDRHPAPEPTPLGAGLGAESGAGAWFSVTPRIEFWTAAPQLWSRGGAPPIERGLASGVVWRVNGGRVWFEHEARPLGGAGAASHRAGVALEAGAYSVWAEGLDDPLRARLGLSARAVAFDVRAGVESHPVLGETLRLAIGWRTGRPRGAEP